MIYNPKSGMHKGVRVMNVARNTFTKIGINVDVIPLEYPGHATQLCETLSLEGYDILCVVGGDGTVHECINGLMKRKESSGTRAPPLSILPAGTGNSMVLELNGIKSLARSIQAAIAGFSIPMDILKVTVLFTSDDPALSRVNSGTNGNNGSSRGSWNSVEGEGQLNSNNFCSSTRKEIVDEGSCPISYVKKEVIYGFNSIHWGLGSKISATAEKLRWMGHAFRYTTAAFLEVLHGTSTRARIIIENHDGTAEEFDDTYCLLIANNIGTAAKGMKMAPKAKINDGLIDLLLIRSHRTLDLMHIFKRVYSGKHTLLPYVEYRQVRKFCVTPFKDTGGLKTDYDPEIAEEVVDIDGELKGCTPFICEVIPHAVDIII